MDHQQHLFAEYTVLIPAYKPDGHLAPLVNTLVQKGFQVLIVNDGSGVDYAPVFEACLAHGAHVVHHMVNLGKGRALKTGLNATLQLFPACKGVITADADGQHTPDDIGRVAICLSENPGAMVIGARAFTGNVPFKSRAGNAITRGVYKLATGIAVSDTQTGLRGLPQSSLPDLMRMSGERYEYEMNMLLKLRDLALPVVQVPIETVYIDNNSGSHFHPLRDSARIYLLILGYCFTSIFCFLLDNGLYWLLLPFTGQNIQISYAIARVLSSLVNYGMNKYVVFGGRGGKSSVVRYYLLAAAQMLVGIGLTTLLANFTFFPAWLAKLPVDLFLFFLSYIIQRDFVFRDKAPTPSKE